MKKNTIRLNESQLHNLIKEGVNRVLKEAWEVDRSNGLWSGNEEKYRDNNKITGFKNYNEYFKKLSETHEKMVSSIYECIRLSSLETSRLVETLHTLKDIVEKIEEKYYGDHPDYDYRKK